MRTESCPRWRFCRRLACLIIAARCAGPRSGLTPFNQPPAPLDAVDRIAYVCIPVAMLLAQGAVVTSVGLALATWIRRVGRAVAVSVTCCAVFAFGWIILVELGSTRPARARTLATANDRATARVLRWRFSPPPARGGPDADIYNVVVAARTEPTRLLHRSSHRAAGDDRDLPWSCSP